MAFLYRTVYEDVELLRRRRVEIVLLINIACLYFKTFYVKSKLAVNYLEVHNYFFLCMNMNEQVGEDHLPFRSQ